jgi:8-oxo-dGTP pyrophosphatase MutT (NUDIX family)
MANNPFSIDGIVETIRRLESGEQQPSEPRHAATVVLLRERDGRPEVYLLRRTASMAFAPGFFVFPGGSVDPRDRDLPDAAWVGPPPEQWAKALGSDEPMARALVCAAVRETFEESGVMLAGPDEDSIVADTSGDDWEADRLALLDRSLSLAELLERRGLKLRADLLRAWAHWITPEVEPKRFDTRFFVAAMPAGQRTRDVGGEADRVAWMRPADALAGCERGEMSMLPPTIANVTDMAAYRTVAEVLAAGGDREVTTTMPRLTLDENDQVKFLLPGDPDYPTHVTSKEAAG